MAPEHQWDQGGQFCSCGQDVVTCQRCGRSVCGNFASRRVVRGRTANVCPKCAGLCDSPGVEIPCGYSGGRPCDYTGREGKGYCEGCCRYPW